MFGKNKKLSNEQKLYGGWGVLSLLGIFIIEAIDNNLTTDHKFFIDSLIEPIPFVSSISKGKPFEYFGKLYFFYQLMLFFLSIFVAEKLGKIFPPDEQAESEASATELYAPPKHQLVIATFLCLLLIIVYIVLFPVLEYLLYNGYEDVPLVNFAPYIFHSQMLVVAFFSGYFTGLHISSVVAVENSQKLKDLKAGYERS